MGPRRSASDFRRDRRAKARPCSQALRPSSRKSISTGCNSALGRCWRGQAPGTGSLASGGTLGREPGRRPADLRVRPAHRGVASNQFGHRQQPGRRSRGRRQASHRSRRFPSRSLPNGARQSASSAPAAPLSPCSQKEGSISARSAGTCCSTAMHKRAWSASAAATCSPTAGLPFRGRSGAASRPALASGAATSPAFIASMPARAFRCASAPNISSTSTGASGSRARRNPARARPMTLGANF